MNLYESVNRKCFFFGLVGVGLLFFIYTNLFSGFGNSSPAPCPSTPIHGHLVPSVGISGSEISSNWNKSVNVTQQIFVREKFRVIQLMTGGKEEQEKSGSMAKSLDLLLNSRKLTLFAVHELNRQIDCDQTAKTLNLVSCPKWWANPLATLAIKTETYPDYRDHTLTFIAEPGSVPYSVKVRQNNIPPTGTNWTELEIYGNFLRLDGLAANLPPSETLSNVSGSHVPPEDENEDPTLLTWPRDRSFMVGDYVDFKNRSGMYHISPGVTLENAQKLYCGNALRMLVMVSSAPKHFEQRKVIRATYGSKENLEPKKVRVVFLFGIVEDLKLQEKLSKEAAEFGDIIQANFLDSYHNLSLSHLAMYNWVQSTCEAIGLPKWVLKADDDFLLNIELSLRVAEGNPNFELIGTSFCSTGPIRNTAYMTKYYTPRYMHLPDRYAGYLSGVAYLVRTDIFPRMLKISLTTPMIHMDDAYITGILPRQLNLFHVGSAVFTYGRAKPDPCDLRKWAASYVLDPKDMSFQWAEFTKPVPPDCDLSSLNNSIPIQPFSDAFKKFCDFI